MKKLLLTSLFFASLFADPLNVEVNGENKESCSQENTEEKIETTQADPEKVSRFEALKTQCLEHKKALIGICVTAVSLIIGTIVCLSKQANASTKELEKTNAQPQGEDLKTRIIQRLGSVINWLSANSGTEAPTPGGEDFDPKETQVAIAESLKSLKEKIENDSGATEQWSNPQSECECSIFALANAMTHSEIGNECLDQDFLAKANDKKTLLETKFNHFLNHIQNLDHEEKVILENEHNYNIEYLRTRPTWKECFRDNVPLDALTYFFFVCIQGEISNYPCMTPPLDEEMLAFLLEEFNKIGDDTTINREWLSKLQSNGLEAGQYLLFAGLNEILQDQIIVALKNLKSLGRICIPLLIAKRGHFVALCIDVNDEKNKIIVRDSVNTTISEITMIGLAENCLEKIKDSVQSFSKLEIILAGDVIARERF